jgi:hypothetical protein
MLGDYMISSDYPEIVISDITLALFEDSGWYSVNYYTGGLFRFGKNMGCEFLNTSCISKGKTKFELDFCTEPGEEICSSGNLDRGVCYITTTSSDIEPNYRYFNNSKTGGFLFADYCPVMMTISDNYSFYSRCDSNSLNNGYKNEIYSSNSICVLNSLVTNDNKKGKTRALCMKVECDYENKYVIIYLDNTSIKCPYYGKYYINEYKGSIICPDFNRVCSGSKWCNDPFSCIEKKSTTINSVYIKHLKNDKNEDSNSKRIKYLKNLLYFILFLI